MSSGRRKSLDPTVAQRLRAAEVRWRWQFLGRLVCGVVVGSAALFVAVGALVLGGWISRPLVAGLLCVLVGLVTIGALVLVALIAVVRQRPHSWFARRMEERAPQLLDRLNTLVFLESRPGDPVIDEYFRKIGTQAAGELRRAPGLRIGSTRRQLVFALAALLAVTGAVEFFRHLRPWDRFRQSDLMADAATDASEFEIPDGDATETRDPWGEVRITEPGGDLKLTKVDVLPLTVEAASNQRLTKASWSYAVNGGQPAEHPLDAPQEPNYAVYQPTLYLDEIGLSDWDVMTYFAAAGTEGEKRYQSEVYFVEVRPFREDILKLDGGGGGKGGQCLAKLSHLIQKQQDVFRQTYRHEQADANDAEQKQDQQKLVDAQADLKEATTHLYAEMARDMEGQGIGTTLDQLALAEGSMGGAVGRLAEPDNPRAEQAEQSALQHLVASRKDLVKTMGNGEGGGSSPKDSPPVAGMKKPPEDQLADIADFRDAGKAALSAVRAAQESEQNVARAADGAGDKAALLAKQRKLARELADFQQKTPAPFEGLDKEVAATTAALKNAELALATNLFTGTATGKAVEALDQLEHKLDEKLSRRQLGDVYRLKEMLDARGEELGRMASGPVSPDEAARTAAGTKATTDALAKTLADTPAGKAFGPSLQDALSGQPGRDLDAALAQMKGGGPGAAAGAGKAQKSVQQIARAFEASLPSALRGAGSGDLASDGGNGMGDATRMLNGLVERLRSGREPKPEDLRKQLEEARLAMLEAAKADPGQVPKLVALAEDLKALTGKVDLHVDADALRKLLDRLESARVEMAERAPEKRVDPELLKADPEKAPAEFRDRVRRYFEKLSHG